ncbi:hypothetical protein IV203_019016 [Nitzschia inconspicua]|uniref:Uncharacterized protein n=1 Tax=Nitzschia inconspicua TaxID=303405 RepID=A0A9K3M086_9STRA|nr:hypothetical protein IV203_022664 [Nitzschia inconspicua]KAG7370446.1 hypothetical protein IV203_019016 [Nitzschia inconspicua]
MTNQRNFSDQTMIHTARPAFSTTKQTLDEAATSARRNQKSVEFDQNVQVRLISSHRTYTAEERAAYWYQPNEYEAIRSKSWALVHWCCGGLRSSSSKSPSTSLPFRSSSSKIRYCTRGLESYMAPQEKELRRQSLLRIVMRLQVDPSYLGPSCSYGDGLLEETIASTCRRETLPSLERALQWGAHDRAEAKRCLGVSWGSKKKRVLTASMWEKG